MEEIMGREYVFVSVPSSGDYQFLLICSPDDDEVKSVSVPSSGDYQFLLNGGVGYKHLATGFPSPHPGIINFFGA